MDLSTPSGCRPRIVSPAGNPEKLEFAVRYGADEVYFGGSEFNLRIQSDNFGPDDIAAAVALCREHGVKSVFLLNSFLHEHDIAPAREYLRQIGTLNFDAVMISDPGMLDLLAEAGIGADVHLSTQMSTLNHLAVNFWRRQGISRIVLAREATVDEIRMIRDNSDAEIEVFAHGALCISYSGRCLLSRYLSGRDANQGNCSHPCRWKYSLIEEKRPGQPMEIIEYARGAEILSSMDLCLLDRIPAYADAGVTALKIEGRMKSLYYAANTTRVYRHAAQCAKDPEKTARFLPFWRSELDLVNHRPYTADLFNEFKGMEFTGTPYVKKAVFMGYRCSAGPDETRCMVKAYNPIRQNDRLDAIYPIDGDNGLDSEVVVEEISCDGSPVSMARPGTTAMIRFDRAVGEYAIFRSRA
jgi:putative protease